MTSPDARANLPFESGPHSFIVEAIHSRAASSMPDPQTNRVIRIRVQAADDVSYHGAIIMTQDGQQVKEHHALAGDYGEIRSYQPTDPVKNFIGMKETLLFNEKADKSRTQDFDRLLARITRNIDFVDKFRLLLKDTVKERQAERIKYDIHMEIGGSLGIKDPDVQILLQPMSWDDPDNPEDPAADSEGAGAEDGSATEEATGPDLSQHIAMTFIISPSTGTPLAQLAAETAIVVRFADPDEEQTSNYMIEQGLKTAPLPESPDEEAIAPMAGDGLLPDDSTPAPKNEIEAIVQSMDEQPDGKTLVYLKLPGERDAFILEEEKSIKVRTVEESKPQTEEHADGQSGSDAANRDAAAPGSSGGSGSFPILAIAGAAALFLILLAFFLA